MLLKKKRIPKDIIDNIEISSHSDKENSDKENSNQENSNEKKFHGVDSEKKILI